MIATLNNLTIAAAIGALAMLAGIFCLLRGKLRLNRQSKIALGIKQKPQDLRNLDDISYQGNFFIETHARSNETKLQELTSKIEDPTLRGYLAEIANSVTEAGPIFNSDIPLSFIEEIVDRLDDLRAIQSNHQEPTTNLLKSYTEILTAVLNECKAELIYSADWDPAIQRAIAKEPTAGIESPSILRHCSSGIRRNGEIIRKQEVVLSVPENN